MENLVGIPLAYFIRCQYLRTNNWKLIKLFNLVEKFGWSKTHLQNFRFQVPPISRLMKTTLMDFRGGNNFWYEKKTKFQIMIIMWTCNSIGFYDSHNYYCFLQSKQEPSIWLWLGNFRFDVLETNTSNSNWGAKRKFSSLVRYYGKRSKCLNWLWLLVTWENWQKKSIFFCLGTHMLARCGYFVMEIAMKLIRQFESIVKSKFVHKNLFSYLFLIFIQFSCESKTIR